MFPAALFTIAKIREQPKCPSVDEWIKQLWHIYIIEYYSVIKKESFDLVTVWMDLENIMLSEINQSEKEGLGSTTKFLITLVWVGPGHW